MTYEPMEDSYLLLEHVKEHAFGKVLDMGTGSGIQALEAAKKQEVEEILAVDANPKAVKQLKEKNNKKIRTLKSDLFSEIKDSFDTIIFNPPYLPTDKRDKDMALDGGARGYEIIEMFLEQAKEYLNDNGFILMVFSNRTGKRDVDSIIRREGYTHEELEKRCLAFFEELYVYKIQKGRK